MAFYVYILRCSDGSYYTGHSDDLEDRVGKHKGGLYSGYTSVRLPVELVFSHQFPTRDEAFRAERQVKGWSRAKKEALIRHDWDRIRELARGRDSLRSGPSTSSG
ncbi:MAG: GIY-YIG nuclease family protein [Chloroflexota bacterium]|nr:GIY-YIG nuclease family protein [Chloroflexota bacterium]MDE2941581.1 GIY-YIG nuclease family protein [Chloroflexota bacterium]